jgi:hypothetical protein
MPFSPPVSPVHTLAMLSIAWAKMTVMMMKPGPDVRTEKNPITQATAIAATIPRSTLGQNGAPSRVMPMAMP